MENVIKRILPGVGLIVNNELILRDKSDLLQVMRVIKDHSGIRGKALVDICGVDRGDNLLMVYEILSIARGERLRVKCEIGAEEIESVSVLWKSAEWLEREVYDMFGVNFIGHNDLRRLLTDYGFKGRPLRKDYVGRREVMYDEGNKVVVRVDEK